MCVVVFYNETATTESDTTDTLVPYTSLFRSAVTPCRIKHREPLRRGRLGSTSKMACARCGGRDVRHYTTLVWQGSFRAGNAGCDHLAVPAIDIAGALSPCPQCIP